MAIRRFSRFAAPSLVTILIALTAVIGACGSDDVEPIHSRALFGFNDDPDPGTYPLQAQLDMPIRRIAIPWQRVEPRRGTWDWRAFDVDYRAMQGTGLRPLIVAVGGPCWAARPESGCPNDLGGVPDPRFDAEWAEYVGRLAARYPRAIGIEIWNEPNSSSQFPPRPDVARYATLLAAAHWAVKRVDPEMPVVSGGLLPTATTSGVGVADAHFLAALYRRGAARWIDAVGAHPYPVAFAPGGLSGTYDEGATDSDLARLRAVRDAAGDSATPIWVTEIGVSTNPGISLTMGTTESEQAHDLVALLRKLGGERDIQVALVHRLVDPPPAPGAAPAAAVQLGFGVFHTDLDPKPAACALSQAFSGSLSC